MTITVIFRASACSLLQSFPKYPDRRVRHRGMNLLPPLIGVGNAQTTVFMALEIKTLHPIQLAITHRQQKNITNSLILLRVPCISISMPKSGAGQNFLHPTSQKRHSMLFLTQRWGNERLGEYSNLSWSVSDPKVSLHTHGHMDLAADQPMKDQSRKIRMNSCLRMLIPTPKRSTSISLLHHMFYA